MEDFENKMTAIGIVIMLLGQAYSKVSEIVAARRRAKGYGLEKAFKNTGGVIDSLYRLYRSLADTEGFHSLRLISAHNSGAELSTTMNWKGTEIATMPHNTDLAYKWNEQPLDPEYLDRVLRPVVTEKSRCVRLHELAPDGSLGSSYARLKIKQTLFFLVAKSNHEIIYAAVSFRESCDLTAEQRDAIRICEAEVRGNLSQ